MKKKMACLGSFCGVVGFLVALFVVYLLLSQGKTSAFIYQKVFPPLGITVPTNDVV